MSEASVGTRVERERLKHALLGIEPAPVRLGRFVIVGRLGAGGMGVVLEAYDPELERGVAIKVLGRHIGREPELRERLRREARALASLSHRNVVGVHEVGTEGEHLFVVMELVRGPTLRSWLAGEKRPWREILAVFVAAGHGLAAAHERGLVHRDFKPDNVLIAHDGTPKVVDFGLVRTMGSITTSTPNGDGVTEPTDERLTVAPLGTPRYMAPEQARGDVVDARSDQYSLCVAMDEAFSVAARDAPPRRIMLALRRGMAERPEARWPAIEALLSYVTKAARPRRTVTLAIGALASLASAAVLWPGPPADCAAAEAAADGIWTPERAAAVGTALAHPDLQISSDSRAWLTAQLDAYVEDWRDVARQSCHVQLAPELAASRRACLEHRLFTFGTFVDGLTRASTAPAAMHATSAVGSLPDPESCLDPPPEVAMLDEIAAMLATVDGQAAAYEIEPGLALASDALHRAEQLGDGAGIAAAHFRIAMIRSAQGRYDLRKESMEASFWAAHRVDDEPTQARAAAFMAESLAAQHGAHELAQHWLELARGVMARGKLPANAEVQVLRLVAQVELLAGKHEQALSSFTTALHRAEAELDPDSIAIATILFSRSSALDRLERYSEAEADLRRAIELMDRAHGPGYLGTYEFYINLGSILHKLGKLDEALEVLEPALARHIEVLGEEHPDTLLIRLNLSAVESQRGDHAAALARLQGVPEALSRSYSAAHPFVVLAYLNRCSILRDLGRPAEALPDCTRARDLSIVTHGERALETAECIAAMAKTLHDLGHIEQELSLRLTQVEILASLGDAGVVEARVDLAVALAAVGRRDEARAVLTQARLAHERTTEDGPAHLELGRRIDQVDAGLAGHDETGGDHG